MSQRTFDPGLTEAYTGPIRRMVNRDGSFNVRRTGRRIGGFHLYQLLMRLSWPWFVGFLLLAFVLVAVVYAALYLLAGVQGLQNAQGASGAETALNALFFSVQTLTTVGYGGIAPRSIACNVLASLEAMTGVLSFAFGAGLLYGRFSRPSARILFSANAIIAPFQGGTALMFRAVNLRPNAIMDLSATVLLMSVSGDGDRRRTYTPLDLERPSVFFFPLTWTVVHPIDRKSPLYGRTAEDLAAQSAEILVLIKGFDDTFSQVVHARTSYRHDEILWGRRFVRAFRTDEKGDLVLEVRGVHDTEEAPLGARVLSPSARRRRSAPARPASR
jgi:inward rectifier potassium channel